MIKTNLSDPKVMTVKNCNVFPIEVIVRDYLTGSTETSIWTNYNKGVRNYCGNELPDGMVKNQRLPETIVTPTTKGVKDELIDENYIIENILFKEEWLFIKKKALELFRRGQELVEKNDILVDTKYEFGKTSDGEIILVMNFILQILVDFGLKIRMRRILKMEKNLII